jgi:hypothetical protein
MNSSTSTTWVQLASLLSRTPSCAEIDRPEAQIPLKPASRTMRADRPLWASIRNSSWSLNSIWRNFALRVAPAVSRAPGARGARGEAATEAFMVIILMIPGA